MGMNVMRVHVVEGRGPAFYKAVIPALDDAGGTVLLGTRALELCRDDYGRVAGAIVRDGEGTFHIHATSTMLASGGFQGNVDMVSRYISPDANYAMLRGLPTNSGDGLSMGLGVGAGTRALHRIHGYLHLPPEPVEYPLHPYAMLPRDGSVLLPPFVQQFAYGIVVNAAGRRFVDETVPRLGDNICNALIQQPGAVGWAIMDDTVYRQHWAGVIEEYDKFWRKLGMGSVRVEQVDSPAALAEALNFNPAAFTGMVSEYNDAVERGTTHLLSVPKANRDPLGYYEEQGIDYLCPIVEPPFRAIKVIAGMSHTNGGLTIDASCRVLDTDGGVIEGLLAAGDTSVLWHSNYASAYARALVTGHVAGSYMSGRAL
jgi:succinate dehydrogenase/fumarate reductase flavoprotein subunit